MAEMKRFECLRCDHRYMAEYDRKVTVERTCPSCGSNSVKLESKKPAKKPAGNTNTASAKG
ncbi:MAG: hypothetical protein JSW67_06185 [Candidatus Latescibacterota bacterium]|nr:MAG: hypothetical protein JSW67_06185 [Candidatus Latescibacterota bacterium]